MKYCAEHLTDWDGIAGTEADYLEEISSDPNNEIGNLIVSNMLKLTGYRYKPARVTTAYGEFYFPLRPFREGE